MIIRHVYTFFYVHGGLSLCHAYALNTEGEGADWRAAVASVVAFITEASPADRAGPKPS